MTRTIRFGVAVVLAATLSFLTGAYAQPKDSLTIGLTLEPPHLDPTAGAAAAIDEVVYANVFEGLTRIDENGAVQPQLAESWTVSYDGRVYTFTLKDGVLFHDGTSFDAHDVVFALDRARAEESVNAQKPLFAAIDRVEAVDLRTVRIFLSRPEGRLLFNLGWGDAVMVAPESANNNKVTPIGTGPYKFDRWVRGSHVRLIAVADDRPLQRVTFRFLPDPSAQVAALRAGDIDAVANLQAPEALIALRSDPNFEVAVGSTEGETILAINNARPPLNDVRVRRAIAHAIDRQTIIDGAMFGFGTPIGTHFAPHHPAYLDLRSASHYDVAKARGLLAEAGQPDLKLTLKLPPPTYARRGGEIVAAQLKEIGIEAEIIPLEWGQWLEQVFRGKNYDLTIVSHTEPLDIGIYGRDGYYFNYDSPDFRALMQRLNDTSDSSARNRILGESQRLIAADAVNAYMFQLAKLGVWRKGLTGMWQNAPVQANDVTGVRWK
ncbi:MAG: ABC transporter substrate-binding protein [Alphaproteobacteria bacterium]|nr:ABC transporter substrate-binding protein [Alphaproteobacteria bacterium]